MHFNRTWLGEIWQYRELFVFLVWRDLKIRYTQTVLGAAWAVLQPLLTMIVFSVLFGQLAKMPSDGIPYPIFSYCALLPWTFFSTALIHSGNSLVTNMQFVTKVYFPRAIVPAAAVLSGLADLSIASLVLLAMMAAYGIPIGPGLLLWPALIVPLTLLAVGLGLFLAAINVRYRDIKYVLPFLIQLLLFLTPIIYPTSMIPERFRFLAQLNPLTGLIEAFRATALGRWHMDWHLLGFSVGASLAIFLLALAFFRREERTFADII